MNKWKQQTGYFTCNTRNTLNSCRFLSLSKCSKGIRCLLNSHSICLIQLASPGRWAEMLSKWRTSADTQSGGEGEVWHAVWRLLLSRTFTYTVTAFLLFQPPFSLYRPPPWALPLSSYFSVKSLPAPLVPCGALCSKKIQISATTGTANHKLEILWKCPYWLWTNQWTPQQSGRQSEIGLY